jgi:hypothetical protein
VTPLAPAWRRRIPPALLARLLSTLDPRAIALVAAAGARTPRARRRRIARALDRKVEELLVAAETAQAAASEPRP